jgi:hypothetical protein
VIFTAPVHTFIVRQSSLFGTGGWWTTDEVAPAVMPESSSMKRVVHGDIGHVGAAQRNAPTGGVVYGIPLKDKTPMLSRLLPTTTTSAKETLDPNVCVAARELSMASQRANTAPRKIPPLIVALRRCSPGVRRKEEAEAGPRPVYIYIFIHSLSTTLMQQD